LLFSPRFVRSQRPVPARAPAHQEGRPKSARQSRLETIKRLYQEGNWQGVVRLTAPQPGDPPDIDYYRGMALAKLKRFPEAKRAFKRGREKAPTDKRFPTELAGLAFLAKNYPGARKHLKEALRLDPHDAYVTNFLATIYDLEGNLEAALKYWNPLGKPVIHSIEFNPQPNTDPVLLNEAVAFSPGAVLSSPDLLTTQARLDSTEAFHNPQVRLQPLPDGQFDAVFSGQPRTGWGQSTLGGFLSLLRGVPYETLYPEFFNIRGSTTNLQSLLRWDPQKERVFALLSGPLGERPGWRYDLYLDGRRENWNLTHTFFGASAPVGNMHMERVVGGADLRSVVNGRLSWSTGIDLSGRTFRNISSNQPSARSFFRNGFALEDRSSLHALLVDVPEERFTLTSDVSAQFGKMLAHPSNSFLQGEAGLLSHWYPEAQGDDFEMTAQLRAGRTWGIVPFDELFILGLERDNNLWLRAHIGTADGKKGSAPLGRNYTLFNWDDYKNVYRNGFLTVRLGPFFDSGKISDPTGDFGSQRWLFDTGLELKVGVLGQATVELFFGKDLRTGATTFYGTTAGAGWAEGRR
jgi:hypothetical protein